MSIGCSASNSEQVKADIFSNRAWHRNGRGLSLKSPQFIDAMFDLNGTVSVAVGAKSYNCSSEIKLIGKTTWPPEAKNLPNLT